MYGPLLLLLLLQAPPKSDLEGAAEALKLEKYAEAAPLLEKALARDPQDFRARFNLALAYSQLNRDWDAIEQYRKVVEQQPGLVPARQNLGMLLLRQKDPGAAVPHLEVAAREKPGDFRAQFYLGESLLGAGEQDRAIAAYEKALALDSRSAAASIGLGRALARAGRMDAARERFLEAARLDPEFRDALLELGDLMEQKQQPAQALELYVEYLKTRPDAVAVRERAAVLLLQQKQYPEAVLHLEQVVKQNPTPANQTALAQAYTMTKEPAKALPLLRGASAAEPADAGLRFRLATALMESQDFRGAAQEFRAVVEKRPDDKDSWNGLGFALYKIEDYEGALNALDQAGQLGPEPPGNHYLRAIILDKFRQYPAALQSYQQFLAVAGGRYPDDEFNARQRVRIITNMLNKR